METTRPETPQSIKNLFQEFLFPCNSKKIPIVGHGYSWEHGNKAQKTVIRDIKSLLCGIDCGQARLALVDCDTYKEEFKKSKEAQAFFQECKKKSKFCYQTPRGGWHFYFKMPSDLTIRSSAPFPGIEIKAKGGYVCVCGHPAELAGYDDWESFYKDLPVFDFKQWSKEQAKQREFGPGKNHKAIPQRAGKAGAKADFNAFKEDMADLLFKNRNNPNELKKHIKDYTSKFKMAMLSFYITPKTELKIQEIQKEVNMSETIQLSEKDIKKPEAFVTDFLLDHEFNFVGGPTKLGKSRALLAVLSDELKKRKEIGLILSTENDQQTMMAPLLKELNAFDNFKFIKDEAAKHFPKTAQHGPEKALVFVNRIRNILEVNKCRCLLIDPLPRFFDWNNEVTVTTFIDGLRGVAKETKTCIIGIRNDGKSKEYEDVHKTKGSSALADIARQILRAIPCHRRSAFGKENKGVKSFVLFTERSGLFKEVAFLFKMEVRKQNGFSVAVPVKIKMLKESMETVKYFCTRESGQTARQKIVEYMEKQNPKRATLDELKDFFDETIPEKTIQNLLYGREFDSKSIGGITYYFPHVASKPEKTISP